MNEDRIKVELNTIHTSAFFLAREKRADKEIMKYIYEAGRRIDSGDYFRAICNLGVALRKIGGGSAEFWYSELEGLLSPY